MLLIVIWQSVCEDDEIELDNQIFSLDYRSIDGDVSLPQNSFKTPEFTPHGQYMKSIIGVLWHGL